MTYKQLEQSREARLWLSQIIIPIVGIVLMVPEAREAAATHIKKVKKNIETKFSKK